MAIKDKVFKGKIKQNANFNFKGIYEFVYDYLNDEGWALHETLYREKSQETKELIIIWKGTKNISDYFKFEIGLTFLIIGMKDVKVTIDGNEVKMQNGSIEIVFDAALVKDYKNKWDSSFMKFFREIYDNYIIRNRIEDYEVKLYEEINEIIATIKSYLAIESQHSY
ncbi:MAG: hypothetical protein AABW83_01055 [Nanoarchaeota archaeon]